jgi:hypothetical protein
MEISKMQMKNEQIGTWEEDYTQVTKDNIKQIKKLMPLAKVKEKENTAKEEKAKTQGCAGYAAKLATLAAAAGQKKQRN